ncbi:Arm DNA-binding domain-containing protein [Pelagerythrobacter aerophilus]
MEVRPGSSKLWRLKYCHAGKEKRLALGPHPEVGIFHSRSLGWNRNSGCCAYFRRRRFSALSSWQTCDGASRCRLTSVASGPSCLMSSAGALQ